MVRLCQRPAAMPTSERDITRNHNAIRVNLAGDRTAGIETLPEEVPIALVFNGISHAVMLATPADLEDFALGFSLAEGILEDPAQLYDCIVEQRPDGIELQLEIAAKRFLLLKDRRRNLAGRTGCGLCGIESLEAVRRSFAPPPDSLRLPLSAIDRLLQKLYDHQPLHRRTHAVHAAVWADATGEILLAREDVGRHNALDKLVGALVKAGINPSAGFAAITSRASVEMVQKAASAGIELLFSISAPTVLAVDTAEGCGLTLAGNVRGDSFSIHTHPQRIVLP